jgi:hypothetical protein
MRLLKSFLFASAIFICGISAAKAEIYYWQDAVSKVSVMIPDTWRMASNQNPHDEMTFFAPGVNDHASCKLRVSPDSRYVIYPQRFSGPLQRMNFSREFWENYAGEYDGAALNKVIDNAGLGRGFASSADISYITTIGPKVAKRGLTFVSLYRDKAYLLECSAEQAAFDKWFHSFLAVAKSVDFRKEIDELPSGDYRDFLRDKPVRIENEREIDVVYY